MHAIRYDVRQLPYRPDAFVRAILRVQPQPTLKTIKRARAWLKRSTKLPRAVRPSPRTAVNRVVRSYLYVYAHDA